MTENIKPGTRVRVTFEGTVTATTAGDLIWVAPDGLGGSEFSASVSLVEILPQPRQFENGGLYYSPTTDAVYRYGEPAERFRALGNGPSICRDVASDEWLGDLVRLVPEETL